MKALKTKSRLLLCLLVVLSFFLPGYNGYSGWQFLAISVDPAVWPGGVTSTDVLIAVSPLVLVPLCALLVLFCYALRIPLRRVYVALPLVFLLFFTGILFSSEKAGHVSNTVSRILSNFDAGFYLALFAVITLPFTKNAKRRHRRHHHRPMPVETGSLA